MQFYNFYKKLKEVKIALLFVTLFFTNLSIAQTKEGVKVVDSNINYQYFQLDNLGRFYYLNYNQLTLKVDSNVSFEFITPQGTDISIIDTKHALRPLLYSKEIQTVYILDNTMSLQHEIDISKYGFIDMICASNVYNHLWFFDPSTGTIKKIDEKLRVLNESFNISQLLDVDFIPSQMLEHNEQLYVNNPTSGIIILDKFSTYQKTIPIKEISNFKCIGNNLYYFIPKQGIFKYDLKSFETKKILDIKKCKTFSVYGNYLYFMQENRVLRKKLLNN